MPHILLTHSRDDYARLIKLPEDGTGSAELRAIWTDASATGEEWVEKIYLIDPEIGDVPMPCKARAEVSSFDEDQYADAKVTLTLDGGSCGACGHQLILRAGQWVDSDELHDNNPELCLLNETGSDTFGPHALSPRVVHNFSYRVDGRS